MSISNKRPFGPKQIVTTKTSLLGPDPGTASSYLTRLQPKSVQKLITAQEISGGTTGTPDKNTPPQPLYLGYVGIGYVLQDYVENTI